jgi:hypothetical protein
LPVWARVGNAKPKPNTSAAIMVYFMVLSLGRWFGESAG